MPLYDVKCKKCGLITEMLSFSRRAMEEHKFSCPRCKNKTYEIMPSLTAKGRVR